MKNILGVFNVIEFCTQMRHSLITPTKFYTHDNRSFSPKELIASEDNKVVKETFHLKIAQVTFSH